MGGYGPDQLTGHGSTVVDDQRVSGTEHCAPDRDEPRVTPAISSTHTRVVERGPIGLDDDPVLDEEVDTSDSCEADLRSNPETQVDRDEADDGFKSGVCSGVDESDEPTIGLSNRARDHAQIGGEDLAQVQGTVDAGHPGVAVETGMRLNQGIDDRHVTRPSPVGVRQPAPVDSKAAGPQSGSGARNVDVHLIRVQHPYTPMPQLRQAGKAAARGDRETDSLVDGGVGIVAGAEADQRSGLHRPTYASIGRTSGDELRPRDVFHPRRVPPGGCALSGTTTIVEEP